MRVALFATCIADQIYPNVAVATVKLLRHLGVTVEFPEGQTCCGQPAFNAGYHKECGTIAKHHIDLFTDYDYVVLPSGSCGGMVREHYVDLFREQSANFRAARDLADRTWELTSFIRDVLGKESIGADLHGTTVTYHDSCHAMRIMGVKDAPRQLLLAAGAEIIEADKHDVCCGFGGLFSIKMPEISSAMARAKHEGIVATQAPIITSTDGGCLMQLAGSFNRENHGEQALRFVHVAELLWEGVERATNTQPVSA